MFYVRISITDSIINLSTLSCVRIGVKILIFTTFINSTCGKILLKSMNGTFDYEISKCSTRCSKYCTTRVNW